MSKFVIEPNKVYPVIDNSGFFFIRVIQRWFSGYIVELAPPRYSDDFSYSDLKFVPAIYTKFELMRLFGPFVFDDPESDEEVEDEEA